MNSYGGVPKPSEMNKSTLSKPGVGSRFDSFTKFIGDGSKFGRGEEQSSILSSDHDGSQASDGPKLGSASTMSRNDEEVE